MKNFIKTVKLGNLKIGSKYPIRIKGMLKTPLFEKEQVIKELRQLEKEGAEAIRIAIKEEKDLKSFSIFRKNTILPLVADIHFHYKLALLSIEAGFDGIRLNPLNIYKENEVKEIAKLAKKYKIPIRVGINSGGFKKIFSSSKLIREMIRIVENYIKILENEEFFDIIISFKTSDINSTVMANRLFREKNNYPLHLGITATGLFLNGVIKSSIGLGILLSEGIGEILRVSLTAESFWEIRVAKCLLQALGLRKFGPQIISCPTCSRCEVDLVELVENFKEKLEKENFNKPINIALMGCVVNGPGEASYADIGVAFGKKRAAIFMKGKILGWTDEKNVVNDLFKEVKELWM